METRRTQPPVTSILLGCVLLAAFLVSSTNASRLGHACNVDTTLHDCEDLACINGTCSYCTVSDECANSDFKCVSAATDINPLAKICERKGLFDPFNWRDGLATFTVLSVGMLTSASGLGGGGPFTSIFIIMGWDKFAIQASLSATAGVGLAMFLLLVKKRHPRADRPLVDFELMLLLQPVILMGTVPGTIVKKLLPTYFIYFIILIVLSVVVWRMLLKYKKTTQKEREAKKAKSMQTRQSPLRVKPKQEAESGSAEETASTDICDHQEDRESVDDTKEVVDKMDDHGINKSDEDDDLQVVDTMDDHENDKSDEDEDLQVVSKPMEAMEAEERDDSMLAHILEKEKRIQRSSVALLLLAWIVTLLFALGRKNVYGGLECGSASYWIVYFLLIPVLAVVWWIQSQRLKKCEERKRGCNYKYADGEKFTTKMRMGWPWAFMIVGFVAAIGIGGGMIIGPLFLEFGMLPLVSSATTGVMVFYTASSAAVQYLAVDPSLDYFFWLGCCGLISGLVGRTIIQRLIEKTGKSSYIVLFILAVQVINFFLVAYVTIREALLAFDSPEVFPIMDIC